MRFKGNKIRWFGHSAFEIISEKGVHMFIDPWITNPSGKPELINSIDKVDLILLTHGHADHIGDTEKISKRTGAKVIAIYEVAMYLANKGINTVGMNMGGCYEEFNIKVCMVEATHSSTAIDGNSFIPLGNPAGFVIEMENGFKIYHAGDTGLFGGLTMIADFYKPNLVMLPVGDLFTMGPAEAAYAVNVLKPDYIMPMHYKTFPALTGSPLEFKAKLSDEYRAKLIIPEVGELME